MQASIAPPPRSGPVYEAGVWLAKLFIWALLVLTMLAVLGAGLWVVAAVWGSLVEVLTTVKGCE